MYGKIIGLGKYLPPRTVSNEDLAQLVETSDQWIYERTGIRERHVMEGDTTISMAVAAAKAALEDADVSPSEVDLIILASTSQESILPNGACCIQRETGAVNATCFDVNAACTGFITAYNIAQSFINTGLAETALVIGSEGMSSITDWTDRGSCILFGDGAGAAVLRADETACFDTVMHADGDGGDALVCMAAYANRRCSCVNSQEPVRDRETYISMDGRSVFEFAVRKVPEIINELLERVNLNAEEIDTWILHQANRRIVEAVAKRVKADINKVPMNMERYGNISAACIPILLAELKEEGRIANGDKVIMSGFGAGLTWAATYLEF